MNAIEWFKGLSRTQAGVVGALCGYSIGIVTGPMVRLVAVLFVSLVLGTAGKSISNRVEIELGAASFVVCFLMTQIFEPIRHALEGTLGGILSHTSSLILAATGAYLAIWLQDRISLEDADEFEVD